MGHLDLYNKNQINKAINYRKSRVKDADEKEWIHP